MIRLGVAIGASFVLLAGCSGQNSRGEPAEAAVPVAPPEDTNSATDAAATAADAAADAAKAAGDAAAAAAPADAAAAPAVDDYSADTSARDTPQPPPPEPPPVAR